jgi:hypothetical protein
MGPQTVTVQAQPLKQLCLVYIPDVQGLVRALPAMISAALRDHCEYLNLKLLHLYSFIERSIS